VPERIAKHRENLALRLETLVRIRWLAVAGQTFAVLFVYLVMRYELPLLQCLMMIAASAWLNVFLRFRYPGNVRWRGMSVVALLGYDILQLTVLLYLTGGIQNPFAILLVVPVVVSAATQRAKDVTPLFALALAMTTLLVFNYQPLPWAHAGGLTLPLEFRAGIWVAIASTMGFTAVYTYRVADESRKLADALAATEIVLQREQHVSNLDGLAAAAAHELGTPLATISLVSKEMLREVSPGTPLHEDVTLLRSQVERCREILQKISSLSSEGDENIARLSIRVMMEELAEPLRDNEVELVISQNGEGDPPSMARNAAVLYGIGNLLENAVDYATSKVSFTANWTPRQITVSIVDDGPGFSSAVLERIGDPFISSREGKKLDTGGGLGLGLFIAKTLLERNGAAITFANQESDGASHGAKVEISWKRAAFEKRA
jgi:two-component system sensor histidine kinase RegB